MAKTLGLAVLSCMLASTSAMAAGCDGVFKHASTGVLPSEGGMEPNGETRKAGDKAHFTGFDMDDGQRYVMRENTTLYLAKDVDLDKSCKLPRVKW